jgi:glycosyltransferase involved in cell wall biosynthesis
MENYGLISVIIPTFNRCKYIREAIDSVLNQEAPDVSIEIIVVDDGSTDNTKKVLCEYIECNKIRYFYQDNGGVASARNKGISLAAGNWITFLDSDDRWQPFHISLQLSVIEKLPNCKIVFSDFKIFSGSKVYEGRGLDSWDETVSDEMNFNWKNIFPKKLSSAELHLLHDGKHFDIYHGNIFSGLLFHPIIPCWTALISRDRIKDSMRFSEKLAIYEEAWLFSLLAEVNEFCFIDVPTAENRGHDGPRVSNISLLNRTRCHITLYKEIYEKSCCANRPSKAALKTFLMKKNLIKFKECVKNNLIKEAGDTLKELYAIEGFLMTPKLMLFKFSMNFPGNPIGFFVKFKLLLQQTSKTFKKRNTIIICQPFSILSELFPDNNWGEVFDRIFNCSPLLLS